MQQLANDVTGYRLSKKVTNFAANVEITTPEVDGMRVPQDV
jgi:hypothetical protein